MTNLFSILLLNIAVSAFIGAASIRYDGDVKNYKFYTSFAVIIAAITCVFVLFAYGEPIAAFLLSSPGESPFWGILCSPLIVMFIFAAAFVLSWLVSGFTAIGLSTLRSKLENAGEKNSKRK